MKLAKEKNEIRFSSKPVSNYPDLALFYRDNGRLRDSILLYRRHQWPGFPFVSTL